MPPGRVPKISHSDLGGTVEHERLTNCQGRYRRGNADHYHYMHRQNGASVSTGVAGGERHCLENTTRPTP